MPTEKERLLEIAAEVVDGKRDRSELEANGITLGEPIVGKDAREMLLRELEQGPRPWWKFW